MPFGILFILYNQQNYLQNIMKIDHFKSWMILALIAAPIISMLIIIKHKKSVNEIKERIYDDSEIKDTALISYLSG